MSLQAHQPQTRWEQGVFLAKTGVSVQSRRNEEMSGRIMLERSPHHIPNCKGGSLYHRGGEDDCEV